VSLKRIQNMGKYAYSGTRTNVVIFRTVLLSRVNSLGYTCYLQQKTLSLQTSLAAELASRKLGKLMKLTSCFSRPGSSVGIATAYGLDGPGIESISASRRATEQTCRESAVTCGLVSGVFTNSLPTGSERRWQAQ
jgi:hypothetical protein